MRLNKFPLLEGKKTTTGSASIPAYTLYSVILFEYK